jgi:uncharacterized protein (DUF427 family)
MKLPSADHPIIPTGQRVRVTLGGTVVAETTRALTLQEASYPAVLYIPREDAAMALLQKTARLPPVTWPSTRTGSTRSRSAEGVRGPLEPAYSL